MPKRHRAPSLLADLAKHSIEAALDAEMTEHLASPLNQRPRGGRRNSRNGTRSKTVRSVIGQLSIDVPRDRWGTFQPVTIGKWQREVVGIDRVLLLLAAKGAPTRETLDLLRHAYPAGTSPCTLTQIADSVWARLRPWHDRGLVEPFPVLHVHVSTLRSSTGQAVGFPVLSVVGTTAPDSPDGEKRELLSLHAVKPERSHDAWTIAANDLYRRGLRGVESVVGPAAAPFREAAANIWPDVQVTPALTA